MVGDVAGHGLRAAASMGQLRNAFRAYGMVEASPAEVVARINRLVMSGVEQVMATVLYLVLDRETRRGGVQRRRPPAAARDRPGRRRASWRAALGPDRRGGPGGVPRGHRVLPQGSTLLLYTDGLVERRDTPLDQRFDELAAAGAAGDELGDLCERVIAPVLGDADPGDDVALLAVRPLPAADNARSA